MLSRLAIVPSLPSAFENVAYYTGGVNPHGWAREVGDEVKQGSILCEYQGFKFYSPVDGRVVHRSGLFGAQTMWTDALWSQPPWLRVPNHELIAWLTKTSADRNAESEKSMAAYVIETDVGSSNIPLQTVFRELIEYCEDRFSKRKSWAISQIVPPSDGVKRPLISLCVFGMRMLPGTEEAKANFINKERRIADQLKYIQSGKIFFR